MRSSRVGWGLLAPTLIILFITGVLPFLYVIYVGFFDWNIFSAKVGLAFAGVNNYRRLVFDAEFLEALGRTLKFAVFAVASEFVLGYFLAQLLVKDFPGKSFFRTIHALPLMVAPIAVGATWRLLMIFGFGPIPYYLSKWFGFDYNIGRFENCIQALDEGARYAGALAFAEQHHRVGEGFDFNQDRDGIWYEGAAQMAVAYRHSGQPEKWRALVQFLRSAQHASGGLPAGS